MFDIIHPEKAEVSGLRKGNNRSCVMRVSTGNSSVLLTGDIEKGAELDLVSRSISQETLHSSELKADIMVVPHHGSLTSSSEAFIRAVQPEYALFPVGFQNRYGFPKPRVVERYLQQKIALLDTARHGAVHFRVGYDRPVQLVSTYRQAGKRYWHTDK